MRAEGYSIRSAALDDLPQLREIERAASILFRETRFAFLVDYEPSSLEFLQSQLAAGGVWMAVDGEDRAVGFAVAGFIDGSPHLHEIDVHPEHGGRGLGTRLLHTVVGWAREGGYAILTLSTFRDIPWNEGFYRNLGFEEILECDLSSGLLDIRSRERELGFPMDDRVCMLLKL